MSSVKEIASDLSMTVHSGAVPLARRVLRFRVMCERADGSTSLERIVATMAEARGVCKELVDSHLDRLKKQRAQVVAQPDRPRRLYFERWVGDDVRGLWEVVDPSNDGFVFVFLDKAPRLNNAATEKSGKSAKTKPIAAAVPSASDVAKVAPVATPVTEATIRSGMHVRCELLPTRTRKGGWFAKVVGQALSGPVTNSSALPTSAAAGDIVVLRVCGVKVETGFVQLAFEEKH